MGTLISTLLLVLIDSRSVCAYGRLTPTTRQRHASLRISYGEAVPTAGYANANVYGFPKGLANQDTIVVLSEPPSNNELMR